jgi:hypothetical protein
MGSVMAIVVERNEDMSKVEVCIALRGSLLEMEEAIQDATTPSGAARPKKR